MPLVDRLRPAGSALDVEKVAVPVAPLWVKVWLNAAPATPLVTDGFTIVMTLQQTGRAGSPAGSDGAPGVQALVTWPGKTPTGGPFVGKVEPESAMVPQAVM